MRMRLHIIESADFIKSTPAGDLDLATSEPVLERLCEVVRDRDDLAILIDLRKAKSVLSKVDIWELADQLFDYGTCFHRKTAILVRPDGSVDQARFFELVAQNRGRDVRVFLDFEQAVYWLASVEAVN